jgi:Cytochrome P460
MRLLKGLRWSFRTTLFVLVAAIAIAGGFQSQGADPLREAPTRPDYNAQGELIAPKGFRSWVFVGADLSPVYKADLPESTPRERARNAVKKSVNKTPDNHANTPDAEAKTSDSFHNIYISREAYQTFLETKTFPDPTILVMEVFQAKSKDDKGVLTGGEFEANRIAFEVAVRDKNRPGGGVAWAYYAFDLDAKARPTKPAPAQPDASCYKCHLKNARTDNVWVQFYPALRDPE